MVTSTVMGVTEVYLAPDTATTDEKRDHYERMLDVAYVTGNHALARLAHQNLQQLESN